MKDIPDVAKKDRIIIVPDGGLHLLPFDALVDDTGRYLVLSHTMSYATSANALYPANSVKHPPTQQTFLGIGGIPYEQNAELTKIATLRGYVSGALVNLPASQEEVLTVQAAFQTLGSGPFFSALNHTFFWSTHRPTTGQFLAYLPNSDVVKRTAPPISLITLRKRRAIWPKLSLAWPAKFIAYHRLL
jgi:hypothetical protein